MRTALWCLPLPIYLLACNNDPGETSQTGETDSTTNSGATTTATDPTGGTTANTSEPVPTSDGPTSEGPTSEGPTSEGPTTDHGSDTDATTVGTTEDLTATSDTTDGTTDGTTTESMPCRAGDEQPCYGGPDASEGVGLCKAGVSTCDGEGTWGACVGEIVPAPESCETPGDEDCDGLDPCAGAGNYAWHKVWGDSGAQRGVRLGFDATGALIVAASGVGTVNLGGGPLVSAGGHDLHLAKYAPDGAHVWSKRYGDDEAQFEYGWALAVDPGGDIVVAGGYLGQIDLGGGPLPHQFMPATFMARLKGDGSHVWSKSFETETSVQPNDVVIGANGEIVLGGHFRGGLDLGGGEMVATGVGIDGFVGKFTGAGEHVWSLRFGDSDTQTVQALAIDPAGEVIVGGFFAGAMNPGNGMLVSKGNDDAFLVRYDTIGNAIWAARYGDADVQQLLDLTLAPSGRITAVGVFDGSLDFGGGPLIAANLGGFVVQLEADGPHRWSKFLGNAEDPALPWAIASDPLGNLLLTGYFNDPVDLGGGLLPNNGGSDVFTLKLGPAGNHVWSDQFGDDDSQSGLGVAASTTGAVAVCGEYWGGINFGGGPSTSKGGYDGFVAVFEP